MSEQIFQQKSFHSRINNNNTKKKKGVMELFSEIIYTDTERKENLWYKPRSVSIGYKILRFFFSVRIIVLE